MKIKKYEQFFDESFSENTFLVTINNKSVLVDPGMIGTKLEEDLSNTELLFVILTHGHADHFLGIKNLDVPIYVSDYDKTFLNNPSYSYAKTFGNNDSFKHKDIRNIEKLPVFEGKKFKVFSTPGHTKGSVCIQLEDRLFSGDTLFVDSVGRTDLFSGNSNELTKSLKMLDSKISNNTIIYPGHGGYAKFKIIKQKNPYMK